MRSRSQFLVMFGLAGIFCAAQAQTQASPPPAPGEATPIHTVTPVAPPPDVVSEPAPARSAPVAKPAARHSAAAHPKRKKVTKPGADK
jgi:hypothetical protein